MQSINMQNIRVWSKLKANITHMELCTSLMRSMGLVMRYTSLQRPAVKHAVHGTMPAATRMAHMSTAPATISTTPKSLTSVRRTPGGKSSNASVASCAATQPSPRLPRSAGSSSSLSSAWPSAWCTHKSECEGCRKCYKLYRFTLHTRGLHLNHAKTGGKMKL